MEWKRKSESEARQRVFDALKNNVDYRSGSVLGIPGTYLDPKVFSAEISFVREAPYLSTLVQNPNHIGCHTLGNSESYFEGTHVLEREVIRICAENILCAEPNSIDGYMATGGTEANLQAVWIYRNYFMQMHQADLSEIAVVCSEDSHYSMQKAGDMFNVHCVLLPVDQETRKIDLQKANEKLLALKEGGVKYSVVVSNMMTTMFGSIDDVDVYAGLMKNHGFQFKIHIDAAYGGFYAPIVDDNNRINFLHPEVNSFTMDAHKMLQAPYGTGIFLIRKDWMKYAQTDAASYVVGADCTISGSRSGANAIAVWLIFAAYGRHEWFEKCSILEQRTSWLAKQLNKRGIQYFRAPLSNIITINAYQISPALASQFGLVPDDHTKPSWFKIVVMQHVTVEKLEVFLTELDKSQR
ncbi:MAG: Pyridoxal-dependent decarboxylase [Fluviicola sp.]|jgi:glutamate/tyrosine decarboxylase-like PLP-dependent enzyme|uniref:pyridoxal phosphate-dependent decarboxylase family protein n=1 Tax=Fluviicola sp. TaxID=1917219 RepID=UPI0026274F71|nr:pyridoxal-dependent decarboxylase [Fluviicola sp.]MDF3026406.1 Pyridoxal-dependent decarboxylase [Fluviicola sp.]